MSDDDLKLTLAGADATVAKSTAPKITLDGIKAKVAKAEYFYSGVFTIAVLTLKNGFKVTGQSAPASPDNYNPDVGNRYAYEDALEKLWPLEGYLLREQLHRLGY